MQFGHDGHCVPAARPLTVSIVAKIQVVRAYSPGSKEQRIEHDGPENKQRRRNQQSEKSRFRAPAEEEAVPPRRGKKHNKQAG